jgi:hypothetical protein
MWSDIVKGSAGSVFGVLAGLRACAMALADSPVSA